MRKHQYYRVCKWYLAMRHIEKQFQPFSSSSLAPPLCLQCASFSQSNNILYALHCNLVTSQLRCDVFIMSVYVRGCICSQKRRVFQGSSVPLKVELQRHAGRCSSWRALFDFEWVKFLLEVVAFICQHDHTACSSIPRSSADWFASVLLCFGWFSNCIDWDKQIQFYALLKSWFRYII